MFDFVATFKLCKLAIEPSRPVWQSPLESALKSRETLALPHYFRKSDPAFGMFGGGFLNRHDEKREDQQWLEAELAAQTTRFVIFSNGKTLVELEPGVGLRLLSHEEARPSLDQKAFWIFLGRRDGQSFFGIEIHSDESPVEDAQFQDLRSVAMQLPEPPTDKGQTAMLALGQSLFEWHQRHAFCGSCGSATQSGKAGFELVCSNTACGQVHFPRTDPVVIMLGVRGDECLLGRKPGFAEGIFSALAGFMEPGETMEEAVRRELQEESGYTGGAVRYVASQPWPFPHTLMIGFEVDVTGGEMRLDGRELEEVRWLERDQILAYFADGDIGIKLPPPLAIAHQLIKNWAEKTG